MPHNDDAIFRALAPKAAPLSDCTGMLLASCVTMMALLLLLREMVSSRARTTVVLTWQTLAGMSRAINMYLIRCGVAERERERDRERERERERD
jgi:hypothetical protein